MTAINIQSKFMMPFRPYIFNETTEY